MPLRLSLDEFEELVEEALESIPPRFQEHMRNIMVEVQPSPSRELLESMGMRPSRGLLGLYHGVPLTNKSVDAPVDWPERILIFQRNIESMCRTREDIVDQVRTTVLHEVGHHFGMDEDDLDEVGFS